MILTDTGPLVALLDKDDGSHGDCVNVAKHLRTCTMLTTWPCFTEAMYLLGEVGGYRYQAELWKMKMLKRLMLHAFTHPEVERMAALMEKYYDVPMDLADASLIVVAESLSLRRVFTLDSDFRIYRLADKTAMEVIP